MVGALTQLHLCCMAQFHQQKFSLETETQNKTRRRIFSRCKSLNCPPHLNKMFFTESISFVAIYVSEYSMFVALIPHSTSKLNSKEFITKLT